MNESEMPVVMFTNYKRTDGFEVSVTLRGTNIQEVAVDLDTTIKLIIKSGGTPVSRQKPQYAPKVVDYVVGEVCPLDGGKLINPPAGTNRPIKCEHGRYDFATKTTSGCSFTKWPKPAHVAEVEQSFALSEDMGGGI